MTVNLLIRDTIHLEGMIIAAVLIRWKMEVCYNI